MFTIGEFSKLSGVSARMLRHYEALALLRPAAVGEGNCYRYYVCAQLETVRQIEQLKRYGFSLSQIAALLPLMPQERYPHLLRQYEVLRAQAAVLQERAQRMADDLHVLEAYAMKQKYEVVLEMLEETCVQGVRRRMPCTGEAIETLIGDAYHALGESGARPAGKPLMAFYGEGFDPEDADIEFLIPVDAGAQNARVLPQMLCAAVTHRGPFERIHGAYDAIAHWFESHPEYRMCQVSYERFLVSPREAERPDAIETRILFPVERT